MTREAAIEELQAKGVVFATGPQDVRRLFLEITHRERTVKVFRSARQCSGKMKHATEDAAWDTAKRMGNPFVRPYECVYCNAWHNGNPPKR